MLILLLQSGGMLFIFQAQQCHVQYQMNRKLKEENGNYEKMILLVSDYESSKVYNKEIRYKGKMYDIKSSQLRGDSIEIIAIRDILEENIIEKIKYLTAQNSIPNNDFPFKLQKLISLVYLPALSAQIFLIPSLYSRLFCESAFTILSPHCSIYSPPPEKV